MVHVIGFSSFQKRRLWRHKYLFFFVLTGKYWWNTEKWKLYRTHWKWVKYSQNLHLIFVLYVLFIKKKYFSNIIFWMVLTLIIFQEIFVCCYVECHLDRLKKHVSMTKSKKAEMKKSQNFGMKKSRKNTNVGIDDKVSCSKWNEELLWKLAQKHCWSWNGACQKQNQQICCVLDW
jgi:hypothetical protein